MKRVYMLYGISLVTHPIFIHVVLLFSALAVMAQFVSFGSVFRNLLGVQVGQVHHYLFNSLKSTDVLTLLLFIVVIVLSISCVVNLKSSKGRSMQFV